MSSEQRKPNSLADRDVLMDLKATVDTHRELGADLEDYVLEAFLARIEQRVDARVAQQSGSKKIAKPKRNVTSESPMKVMGGTLALSIPLSAIAGSVAEGKGLLVVMATVVIINVLYFIDRWVQMGYTGGARD
jgi:hypothetical protein